MTKLNLKYWTKMFSCAAFQSDLVFSLNKNLNEICIIISMYTFLTQPQFNVLSGGLIKWLNEPRQVGVSTAESLTTTLLSIPQRFIGKIIIEAAEFNTRLTVVIKHRSLYVVNCSSVNVHVYSAYYQFLCHLNNLKDQNVTLCITTIKA